MADDDVASDDALVDLEELVARWSDESALDDELAAVMGTTRGDDIDWIPLTEAEEVAGVSRSTLRAWYRGGRIPSRLMPGPHGLQRLVPRDAVIEQAGRSPRTGASAGAAAPASPAGHAKGATPVSDTVRLAEMAVAEARERADRAETRADAAETALHAALERAAAAEAEVRLLRDVDRQ